MSKTKLMIAAAILCGGLTATAASAMPIAPVQADTTAQVEQVRWVCGPFRCWWQPGYYGYYGYGYPYRGYGYGYPYRGYYGYGYPYRRYWRRPYWW
jgi:hypothetical protein